MKLHGVSTIIILFLCHSFIFLSSPLHITPDFLLSIFSLYVATSFFILLSSLFYVPPIYLSFILSGFSISWK